MRRWFHGLLSGVRRGERGGRGLLQKLWCAPEGGYPPGTILVGQGGEGREAREVRKGRALREGGEAREGGRQAELGYPRRPAHPPLRGDLPHGVLVRVQGGQAVAHTGHRRGPVHRLERPEGERAITKTLN